MNVNLLFYTCVSDWTLCLGCAIMFSLQILFCALCGMSFDFVTIPWHHCLIESYCYSSLKGCVVCCPSENCLQSLHSVTGFTACLCCLHCCFVWLTDFAFVDYHQHSHKNCISKDKIFTHFLAMRPIWPFICISCLSSVEATCGACPLQTVKSCRQVKATPSLKPTQSLRSQSAIQVPQEEGCLLMCFKRHDWFQSWEKEILLLFPIDGNLKKRKELVWF